jgi:hypothetical protein
MVLESTIAVACAYEYPSTKMLPYSDEPAVSATTVLYAMRALTEPST